MSKYKIHPLAELFPMMEDAEIADLAADIKANGMRASITLFEEKVLDGRNRLKACELAGVEPKFREHKGGEALAFVLSANLHRRHLTTSQRAMVASKLENMPHGRSESKRSIDLLPPVTRAEAAEQLSVSPASVKRASKVSDESPKLANQVLNGTISLNKAVEKLKEAKAVVIPKDAPKPPAVLDVDGIAVPPIAMQFWNRQPEVRKILSAISEIEAVLSKAQTDGDMMFSEVIISGAICDLRNAKSNIAGALPQHVCNCQGLRSEKCTLCKGKGILSNFYYKTHVPKDVREFRARCKK